MRRDLMRGDESVRRPESTRLLLMERTGGAVVLIAVVWRLVNWNATANSLISMEPELREAALAALLSAESTVACVLLAARRRLLRASVVLAFCAAMSGGRLILEVPRTCHCLGPALPSWVALTIVFGGALAAVYLITKTPVRAPRRWSGCVAAPAFVCGLLAALVLHDPQTWAFEGTVGPDPDTYSLVLNRRDAEIVAAVSSCECLRVVSSSGRTIEVRLVAAIPQDVVPYLRLQVRSLDSFQAVDIAVSVARAVE